MPVGPTPWADRRTALGRARRPTLHAPTDRRRRHHRRRASRRPRHRRAPPRHRATAPPRSTSAPPSRIGDVLGDAVTPELAAAGDEVYWLMTNALINQEHGLYSARGVRADTVWRPWQVEKKIRETADVVTFVVKRIDDRLVKTSLPGQYVTVKMLMPDGVHQPRQYSLTRADDGEHRQFCVKRVHGDGQPDGEVSNLLHDAIGIGDVLTMSLPYGDVVLDDAGRPVVFASAGIGIAPMAGMLSHLVTASSGLNITLLHADPDEASFALIPVSGGSAGPGIGELAL